jgi:hypothetical protein
LLLGWDLGQIENFGLNDSDRISGITKDSQYLASECSHKNFHASLFPTSLNVFSNINYAEFYVGIGLLDKGFNLVVIHFFEEIANLQFRCGIVNSAVKLVPEDYLFVVDLLLAFRDFQVVLQQEKETFVGTLIWNSDESAIDIKEIGKLDNFVR